MLTTRAFAPPRALARFVECVRVIDAPELARLRYERLPDGKTELVVRIDGRGADAGAMGTRTRAVSKDAGPLASAVVVRFRAAGAYPFFGMPMSELTDRHTSIETLWGGSGRALEDALAGARSGEARVRVMLSALEARLASDRVFEPAAAATVRRATRTIAAMETLPRVDALAAHVGLSERQLRRAFDAVIGVGPKHYLRIVRFQRAIAMLRADVPRPPWGVIARDAGYFDQAHMIAELREMTGRAPSELARRLAERRRELALRNP
ncbi:helix-turn-helix transcriptional regulator [Sandaracinus amylolyticus]|uniref:helix-turn-helix transcriptional regulator n=1 Tax=Sandaracinus amylolyticus TaxID=927083 RepID=UPI001F0A1530|nr:helix-turn-helix transcriptional regulator [Sandaracinus amylolyticus]